MSRIVEFPSRPRKTEELIERLKHTNSDAEKRALRALCKRMITIFKDDPKSSYVLQAVALSSVAKDDQGSFKELVTALASTIINGTTDPHRSLLPLGSRLSPPLVMNNFLYRKFSHRGKFEMARLCYQGVYFFFLRTSSSE